MTTEYANAELSPFILEKMTNKTSSMSEKNTKMVLILEI